MGEEDKMKRRHHTPEQIVCKLREADRLLGKRSSMVQVCKHLEATENEVLPVTGPIRRDESAMMQNG
jgi:hypothetical protein